MCFLVMWPTYVTAFSIFGVELWTRHDLDADSDGVIDAAKLPAGSGTGITGITGQSGGTTIGSPVTITGAGIVATSRSGDTVTVTGTEVDSIIKNLYGTGTFLYATSDNTPQAKTLSEVKTLLSIDDLITLSGISDGVTTLGTFTGLTIADNQSIKQALQALETALELVSGGAGITDEELQDKVGAMFTGNTETGATVTYQDDDGTIDIVVDTETSHADVVQDGDFTSQGIMLRGASSGIYSILTDNSSNWNTAYGWGNHALAGYVTGTPWTTMGYLTAITGSEEAFTGWDKNASDDFSGAYSALSGTPLTFAPASHGDAAHSETYLKTEVDGSTSNEIEVQDEAFLEANFNGATATGVSQDDFYDRFHLFDADDDGVFTDELWFPSGGIDWTQDQGAVNIHAGNYIDTNTTYTATDFDIKDLTDSISLRSTWSGKQDALGFTPENHANLRMAFQITPDDIHYPSEKLVKDSLDGKESAFDFGTGAGDINTDDIPEGGTNKYEKDSGTNTGDEPDASLTVKGIIEIADDTESLAGTDTGKAVTPAGVKIYGDVNYKDPAETAASIGDIMTGADAVTTIADADTMSIVVGGVLKKITGVNAKSEFGGLSTVAVTSPIFGDGTVGTPLAIDSAAVMSDMHLTTNKFDMIDGFRNAVPSGQLFEVAGGINEFDIIYAEGYYVLVYNTGFTVTKIRRATTIAGLAAASDTTINIAGTVPSILYDGGEYHLWLGAVDGEPNTQYYHCATYNGTYVKSAITGPDALFGDAHVRKNPVTGKFYMSGQITDTEPYYTIILESTTVNGTWTLVGTPFAGTALPAPTGFQMADSAISFYDQRAFMFWAGAAVGDYGDYSAGTQRIFVVELDQTTWTAIGTPYCIKEPAETWEQDNSKVKIFNPVLLDDPTSPGKEKVFYSHNSNWTAANDGFSYLQIQQPPADGRTNNDVVYLNTSAGKDIATGIRSVAHGSGTWEASGLRTTTVEGGAYGHLGAYSFTCLTAQVEFTALSLPEGAAEATLLYIGNQAQNGAEVRLYLDANKLAYTVSDNDGATKTTQAGATVLLPNTRYRATLRIQNIDNDGDYDVNCYLDQTSEIALQQLSTTTYVFDGLQEFTVSNNKGRSALAANQFNGTIHNVFVTKKGIELPFINPLPNKQPPLNIETVGILVNDATALTTGDGKAYFRIGPKLANKNLYSVAAHVQGASSSGAVNVMIRNSTDSTDMLSTAITVDATEIDTLTAAIAAVVNASYDDVVLGDWLAIDVDGAGTGATWLYVELNFR